MLLNPRAFKLFVFSLLFLCYGCAYIVCTRTWEQKTQGRCELCVCEWVCVYFRLSLYNFYGQHTIVDPQKKKKNTENKASSGKYFILLYNKWCAKPEAAANKTTNARE